MKKWTLMLGVLAPSLLSAGQGGHEPLPEPRHPVVYLPGSELPVPVPFKPGNVYSGQAKTLRHARGTAATLPFPSDLTPAPKASWTLMVYMVGENDLEPYIVPDMETELAARGSGGGVQVLALADRVEGYDTTGGDWTDTKVFHVTAGMTATADRALSSLGERNMGDPATLAEFITFAKTNFPADHYALAFWDHGWDWRPGSSMLDETDADTLDQDEIAAALAQAGGVDVVGWDACMMASLEVMSTVRPYAKAMVGSEDYVGWEGFRYDEVIDALAINPLMSPDELAQTMGAAMILDDSRTVSAVALDARWDVLQGAMDQLAGALIQGLPKYRSQYEQAWKATQEFSGDHVQKDLYHAVENLYNKVPDATVKAAASDVAAALQDIMLYEWHRDAYRGAYGVSIYWPGRTKDRYGMYTVGINDFDYYRNSLNLAQTTRWDDFLSVWLGK